MEDRRFTPETECENVAQFFPGSGWVPAGKQCGGGSMSMANALAYSKNCATAYIMKQVGPKQFAEFLSRLNVPNIFITNLIGQKIDNIEIDKNDECKFICNLKNLSSGSYYINLVIEDQVYNYLVIVNH